MRELLNWLFSADVISVSFVSSQVHLVLVAYAFAFAFAFGVLVFFGGCSSRVLDDPAGTEKSERNASRDGAASGLDLIMPFLAVSPRAKLAALFRTSLLPSCQAFLKCVELLFSISRDTSHPRT